MKYTDNMIKITLSGNPNVGKSTVFNALTGLHQHTGNWTGKTVDIAAGYHKTGEQRYQITDLPGSYSLSAHSAEEEVTRDFLLFEEYDCAVIVCDATKLSRNLGLALQIMEIAPASVLVLNLIDEAERMHLELDAEKLSDILEIPVIKANASNGKGVKEILFAVDERKKGRQKLVLYDEIMENAVEMIVSSLEEIPCREQIKRYLAMRLLEGDKRIAAVMRERYEGKFSTNLVENAQRKAWEFLEKNGMKKNEISSKITVKRMEKANKMASLVTKKAAKPIEFSSADRFCTGKISGFFAMFLLVFGIFWLTTVGANFPSAWLSSVFHRWEKPLYDALIYLQFPAWTAELLALGVYRTLAWIVSVMLPPMLIFFPLFTILEDVGYLPRLAFQLDGAFCRCGACGKQGLTMCMGLGCNAVGVTGCRIIDSKKERCIAVLTNAFMPCNGRYPAMIAIASVFFSGFFFSDSLMTAWILTFAIMVGVLMTFFVSWILSHTLLKGTTSSFLLEIPPFRRPQFGKILIRSFLDRTVFVLLRAVKTAVPAGFLIWILSHVLINDLPLTGYMAECFDPLGKWMGLDGVILLAFLLGLPANEIVLPLCIMLYHQSGLLSEIGSISELSSVLTANGWTWQTAICFLLFTVLHSPCMTTLLTVKKETGSRFYMILAFLIPTGCGILICGAVHACFSFFS